MTRSFFCTFLALSSTLCFAGVDFTPHPGFDPPKYFSGTNARAFYAAHITFPDFHIEASQMLLNGNLVASDTYSIPSPPNPIVFRAGCTTAVMFDSSHFHPYAPVEVKYRVKTGGVWYEHTYSVPNRNTAYAWNHEEFDLIKGGNGAATVASLLDSAKYHTYESHGGTAQLFEDAIRGSIIYVNSHGGPGIHSSFLTQPEESIEAAGIGDFNYPTGRLLNNGTGLPPMNSTGLPPVNLLLLDVCQAGLDSELIQDAFGTALYPFGNVYAPNSFENQAVHAYTVFIRVADSEVAAEALVGQLASGKSILQASTYLLANAESLDVMCSDEEFGENRPLSLTTDRNIGGDIATRIKNVYTGLTGDSNVWYRLL